MQRPGGAGHFAQTATVAGLRVKRQATGIHAPGLARTDPHTGVTAGMDGPPMHATFLVNLQHGRRQAGQRRVPVVRADTRSTAA